MGFGVVGSFAAFSSTANCDVVASVAPTAAAILAPLIIQIGSVTPPLAKLAATAETVASIRPMWRNTLKNGGVGAANRSLTLRLFASSAISFFVKFKFIPI
jgi:hypothetical protein